MKPSILSLSSMILGIGSSEAFSNNCCSAFSHREFSRSKISASDNSCLHHPYEHLRIDAVSQTQGEYGVQDSIQVEENELDIEWREHTLKTPAVKRVREALVKKYLQIGKSLEYAESEVDEFLNDRERSEKFVKMRAFAVTSRESFTWEDGVQLAIAFIFGAMMHMWSSPTEVYTLFYEYYFPNSIF